LGGAAGGTRALLRRRLSALADPRPSSERRSQSPIKTCVP
jgi:hypothetical protein